MWLAQVTSPVWRSCSRSGAAWVITCFTRTCRPVWSSSCPGSHSGSGRKPFRLALPWASPHCSPCPHNTPTRRKLCRPSLTSRWEEFPIFFQHFWLKGKWNQVAASMDRPKVGLHQWQRCRIINLLQWSNRSANFDCNFLKCHPES